MTDRLEPSDSGYGVVYQAWLTADKPAVVHMANGQQWMKLATDNKIVFILLNTTDNSLWNSTSMSGIIR